MTEAEPITVAHLHAEIDHHRCYYPSNAIGTAQQAVNALQRLIDAAPSEVFAILDELRGTGGDRD